MRLSFFLTFQWFLLSFSLSAAPIDTLTLGYKLTPPFVHMQNGQLEGPSVWLWKQVAAEKDIPYRLIRLSLRGILDSLSSGDIDLSLSPLTITSDRSERMGFSPPYYIEHASLLVPEISAAERAWEFLSSFFSINFFRALGALCVVILAFGLLAWLFERRGNTEEFDPGPKGLWQGFWWSAVTMTTVGYGDKSPRTFGGRVVALIWMFTAIIIISGFTASIASSLTMNRISSASNRIQDFKERRLGTVANSGTEGWLRDNFYNQRQAFPIIEDATALLLKGELDAVAYDRAILQYQLQQDTTHQMQLLDIEFYPQFYAMGMRQRLPDSLETELSVAILEATESMDWKVLLAEYDLD